MILLASSVGDAPRGGIPVVNHLVMAAWRDAGRSLQVASLHDSPDARWLAGVPGARAGGGSRIRFVRGALALRDGVRPSVLATHVGLAPIGRMVAARRGGRLFVFLHGVECWRPLPARTSWGLRGARGVIANSRWTLERFREANPFAAAMPAEVCHLPARDLPVHPDPDAVAGRSAGELRILVVGRLWGRGMEKGQDLLIDLLPQLRRRHATVTLRIVGEGEGRSPLEQLARERGVADAVHFSGSVEDAVLDAEYRRADLFAMPGRGEGFGLVFAEAMARGLPCVASAKDAGGEVVQDGVTGLLVDPEDRVSVLAALERLVMDGALRRRLGEAGPGEVARRFSTSAFRRRILDVVDGAVDGEESDD